MPDSEADSHADDPALADLLGDVARAPVYQAEWKERDQPPRLVPEGCHTPNLPQPGETIDAKYRVEAVLGEGGMGIVYAATQLNTRREVALKWMHPDRLGRTKQERERAAMRFAREARVAAHIDHPNRVEVFDVGGDPDHPYLVMERLRGESLRARMDRVGPMGWQTALPLLDPVFDLLEAAHAAGVVHRDLKPDNLFLTRDRHGNELAKVLDFGISRLHDGEQDEEPTLTRTGSVLGTPAYMPLEQLRGERALDARADVYALGVVLYEMLSATRPYQARNAADYAAALATGTPIALGVPCPALRGERERVVMRALAREASQRHQDVAEFRQALHRAGAGSHLWRRYGVRSAITAGVAVSVAALLTWMLATDASPPQQASVRATHTSQIPPASDTPVQASPVRSADRTLTPDQGSAKAAGRVHTPVVTQQPPARAEREARRTRRPPKKLLPRHARRSVGSVGPVVSSPSTLDAPSVTPASKQPPRLERWQFADAEPPTQQPAAEPAAPTTTPPLSLHEF